MLDYVSEILMKVESNTRFSIVFHNAPKDVQVYQYEDFFLQTNHISPRYGFQDFHGRSVALSGNTAFM